MTDALLQLTKEISSAESSDSSDNEIEFTVPAKMTSKPPMMLDDDHVEVSTEEEDNAVCFIN